MSVAPENMKAASVTPTAEQKLEKMLKDFQAANKTATDDPGKNLRDLLDHSPDLKKRILDAVDKGYLESFKALPAGSDAGGAYSASTKMIELPMDYLKQAGKDKTAAAELVFVMGHEIQHAFYSPTSNKALDAFGKEVEKIGNGPGPHDYTHAIKTVLDNDRKDEAQAHIGGFNAISSQVMKDNPKATLKDLYNAHPDRMDDFIDRSGTAPKFSYALKPGLTIDKDMHIPATPQNIEAMGKYYFDQPPSATGFIGANGKAQDYRNNYGESYVNTIADFEKTVQDAHKKADPKYVAPEVRINMKEAGLNPDLITTGMTYKDTSPKKHIDSPQPAHASDSPSPTGEHKPSMHHQAITALQTLGPQSIGLKNREELENAAAGMAVKAPKDGLSEISGALKGNNSMVIAYQGDPASEHVKRSATDVNQTKTQSAATTLESAGPTPPVDVNPHVIQRSTPTMH